MDTNTLLNILKRICKCSNAQYDVLACDQLTDFKVQRYPACIVINNKPISHEGEHWVGMYIRCKHSKIEFFDSYGMGVGYYDPVFVKFISKNRFNVTQVNRRLQGLSNLCGHYVIVYMYMRLQKKSVSQFYRLFNNNSTQNDKILSQKFKSLFKTQIKCKKQNKQICKINN